MSYHLRSCLLAFVLAAVVTVLGPRPAGAVAVQHGVRDREEARDVHVVQPEETGLPALPRGERAVRFALREVGTPYRWGGESPATGFDCSGLVRWAYEHVGVDLPHSSYALYGVGRPVPTSKLAPGDILFFDGLGHVGLYVGKGEMVHAPQTGQDVAVVALGRSSFGSRLVGARRVVVS